MPRFAREELEHALSVYNAARDPARDAPRVVKAWREAGGQFLTPEQVQMRHR